MAMQPMIELQMHTLAADDAVCPRPGTGPSYHTNRIRLYKCSHGELVRRLHLLAVRDECAEDAKRYCQLWSHVVVLRFFIRSRSVDSID